MTAAVIVPGVDELKDLPTPLTDGEERVLHVLRELLPEGWEVYVQPHLNGLRPDFVLLHPAHGIAVYEVKDWNLRALEYYYDDGSPPTLRGRRGGRSFSLAAQDPVRKVGEYKKELHNLYCPSLPSRDGFGAITAGVIFPIEDGSALRRLFEPPYTKTLAYPQNPLVGRDDLNSGDLARIFPLAGRRNRCMSLQVARELRSWLLEPDVSREQREPLELDEQQQRLVLSRTKSGYRRIKGPAGSGKSVVLAARAAELARSGKSVLVVTFNITLLNYLRDLAVRWWRGKEVVQNITWLNFHAWGKRVAFAAGEYDRYSALWKGGKSDSEHGLNDGLATLVRSLYDAGSPELPHYDAILVDEGQDFRLRWWNALRAALAPGGEMLLAADPTQDLYETARKWTEQAMVGAGFPGGRWTSLRVSHRLPPTLVPFARDFAARFLPNDELTVLPVSSQLELPLSKTVLRWFQVAEHRAVETCAAEILGLPSSVPGSAIPWADVTFLSARRDVGTAVVKRLERHGLRILHTFHDEGGSKEDRRRKLAFFKGAPQVKATTVHSFKGWESRALVVHIASLESEQDRATAYAAITRLKRHGEISVLSVICSAANGAEYGATWPTFRSDSGAGLGADPAVLEDFDDRWSPIMIALAAHEGVTLEPGREVMRHSRVVDLDLATVSKAGESLRLVDEDTPTSSEVFSALEALGQRALRVRPNQADVVIRVLEALAR